MKKFFTIGVIGSNEGNGHPISFSTMFNGYNLKYLNRYCDFPFNKRIPSKISTKKKI